MGNSSSTSKMNNVQSVKLAKEIDYIAANYITTQNFRDMERLADLDHCNNLVIMTANLIANNLNDLDIKYLAQRLKNGIEINEMTEDSVVYFKKADIEQMDVNNKTTKRRLCIGIAKFYVKVAHLFAAIVTTVNPIYVYKDAYGSTVKVPLLQKENIPKEATTKIQKYNICSQRLNALINNQDFDAPVDAKITVSPDFCDINYDKTRGKTRNLFEEPGIPELEKLYYDIYDYDNGGFKGMSDKMRKEVYDKDVVTFFRAFTGNENIPLNEQGEPTIKKFSDILLRDYHKSDGCKKDEIYTKQYTASLKNKLFGDYANHIKEMMNNTTANQDKLVAILETLFSKAINPQTQRQEIIINPKMSEELLQSLVVKARATIVEMYIKCEDDFVKGLELFEAIVEKQIQDTSKAQIEKLEAALQDSLANSPTKPSETDKDDEEKSKPSVSKVALDPTQTTTTKGRQSVLVESDLKDDPKDKLPVVTQKNISFMPAVYVPSNNNLIVEPNSDFDN